MNKIALRVTDAAYALSCSSGVIYKLIRRSIIKEEEIILLRTQA